MLDEPPVDSPEKASSQPGWWGRTQRVLARAACGVGLGCVFVGAAASAVVLHLDLAAARRVVCAGANDVLGSIFEGKIVIDEVEHIDVNSLRIHSAVAIHPSGEHVIRARRIRARVDMLSLARRALFGSGELEVNIPFVHILHGDVLLDQSAAGRSLIAETFALKPRAPSTRPRDARQAARPVHVALERIEIVRAWVHGEVAPPRSIDADVSRFVGSVRVGPGGVSVDVDRTGLVDRAFLPARTSGTANYHLRVELPAAASDDPAAHAGAAAPRARMWTAFAGRVGPVEVLARAEMDQRHLSATVELPRAAPEDLAVVIPGYPVREPVSASLSIEGDIPRFDVKGRIGAAGSAEAGGEIKLLGAVDAAGPVHMQLDVAARDVALSLFEPQLAPASLTAGGRVRIALGEQIPRLSADIFTEPMQLAAQPVPAAEVHLVFDRGALSGNLRLLEEGMPIDGTFVLTPRQGVAFGVSAEIPSIEAAPRIAGPVKGSASVRAKGTFRDGKLDAEVGGMVSALRAEGGVALDQGRVEGRISGTPGALELSVSLSGTDLRAGGYDFDRVEAGASGPITAPAVRAHLESDEGDTVDATGRLDTKNSGVHAVAVEIHRAGQKIEGEIARVGKKRGGIAVEGVKIHGEGIGSVEGGLAVRNRDITGKLRADGIDLERLAKLLGVPYRVRGIANVDIALEHGDKGRSGHVLVELENGSVPLLSGLSANWTASFDNDALAAGGTVRLVAQADPGEPVEQRCDGAIAEVTFSGGEGRLKGPLLDKATWEGLVGSVHVEANDWNLRCLSRLIPIGLPISDLSGMVSTRFDVMRDPDERFPSVHDFVLRTRQLEVAGRAPLGADAPEWESRFIDVLAQGNFNGKSGESDMALTLFDDQRLADLSLRANFDLPVLVDEPRRRRASLLSSAISARLSTPRRPLASFATLPTFVSEHLPPLAGDVELGGSLTGTLDEPVLTLQAKGFGIAHSFGDKAEPSLWALPVDVEALLTYGDGGAPLGVKATVSRTDRTIARLGAAIETDLRELYSDKPKKTKGNPPGEGAPLRWTGGFQAELLGVPLGEIPFFADQDVTGNLSGIVSASGLNRDPSLALKLDMPSLQIGPDVRLQSGTVALQVEPADDSGRSRAFITADILAEHGGRLSTNAYCGVLWPDKRLPEIDPEGAADLLAHASNLPLGMLQPFVTGVLSKLEGKLNGTVRVGFRRLGEGEQGRVDAYMTVNDGVVHIPQLGQELRDASMTIISNPLGVVRFEKVQAKGMSGKLRGSALARFDGLRFKNVEGELSIAPEDAIPLTLEGVPLGTAYGTLRFVPDVTQQEGEIALRVKVPTFHLELPAASGRNVQPLEENPDIVLSHPLDPTVKKEELAKDALAYRLTFDIDQMRVEGTGIDVTIASADEAPPRVEIHGKTSIGGQIEIVRGKFEVFSKVFEIERGIVRMREEETSNPYLNITAHWDAPDSTRVFVDFIGTLRPFTDDKLRFRSNPPRSDQEILATLLFGTDSASSTAADSSTSTVGQVAGGVAVDLAASQFNSLFAGTPFRAQVGTTEEGGLKTGVSYELGDTVTAGASVEAPSGEAAGRAEVNVDWRFKRNWTLRGSFGIGAEQPTSGVDVLWQYRY